jgi:hypothetical protein
MMLLGEGNWLESRGILEGMMQAPEPCELCPKVYFYVGLLDLLQMEDPSQMEAGRDYMRAYPQKYPQGPFLRNAERIAQLLDKQIEGRRKEQQRLKTLNQKVQGQAKEIDTLKFQIQQLEEIHRETEETKTRETLDPDGKGTRPMPELKGEP